MIESRKFTNVRERKLILKFGKLIAEKCKHRVIK